MQSLLLGPLLSFSFRNLNCKPIMMALTESDVVNGGESNHVAADGKIVKNGGITVQSATSKKKLEFKDTLSFANILKSRNKFVEALSMYQTILEKDSSNVEAYIGKGICLQTQNMISESFECFLEVIKLDPHNACALTHCGILYKDGGLLQEAAEVGIIFISKLITVFM